MKRAVILGCVLLAVCGALAAPVFAQNTGANSSVELTNPLGGTQENPKGEVDLRVIFGTFIGKLLTILGSVALFVFLIGGFEWITSAGNSEKVQMGAKTMMYAAVGIFVIFIAYGLTWGVLSILKGQL